jgi:hypothetical protein
MKARLIITAQYSENYAFPDWNGEGECPKSWKFKSGVTFEVEVDSLDIMYLENECVAVATEMLKEMSNDCVAYSYHAHEVKFGEDKILDADIFKDKLKSLCEAKRA